LDIAEKRLPQDGRIQHRWGEKPVDIRVSTLPTMYGEKIVMRLLINRTDQLELSDLGLRDKALEDYLSATRRPSGITLISGPTGSGKTTTLYATLKLLNEIDRNIITIEDPIEYTLEGINQVQLREAIGLDFASALRTFLRQDPDTIMVGEIRDLDTARMAVRASLTGHQVLSTIHTNNAWGIVSRLLDLGLPAYLLADTLNAAVAQRLVRTLCPHCKQARYITNEDLPAGFAKIEDPMLVYEPQGCPNCYFTGYTGRKGIYEVILIDRELAQAIRQKELDVRDILREKGIKSLGEQAFALLRSGNTALHEVYPLLT
ncbi:MAG: GspE/PulE family protein, partial [Bacteroidota bacterium]